MTATPPATHYLEHLLISQTARPLRPATAQPAAAERLKHLLGLLLLLLAGVAAAVVGRLVEGAAAGAPARWPQHGCVDAAVEPLGRTVITGQAQLCRSDGGTVATLDLEHLEPLARYGTWVAYFEQPDRCRFATLQLEVPTFHVPCTLADLEGPDPTGVLQHLSEAVAEPAGATHVDERLDRLAWRRHAQVWLLVERPPAPSASQLMPPIWILTEVAPKLFEARAIFELP